MSSYEQIYLIYFWIFNFREFVKELENLMQIVLKINKKKTLNFPIRLWELPTFTGEENSQQNIEYQSYKKRYMARKNMGVG